MNNSEKLQAMLEFLGPELIPQYSSLIREMREKAERETHEKKIT